MLPLTTWCPPGPFPIPEFGKYIAELHANLNQPFKDLYQVCTSCHIYAYKHK